MPVVSESEFLHELASPLATAVIIADNLSSSLDPKSEEGQLIQDLLMAFEDIREQIKNRRAALLVAAAKKP